MRLQWTFLSRDDLPIRSSRRAVRGLLRMALKPLRQSGTPIQTVSLDVGIDVVIEAAEV